MADARTQVKLSKSITKSAGRTQKRRPLRV